ncbi:MAG: formylglycine-generating enzyme family protein [Planctomycetaceae bacterium]|nr:formylglycine-generating enzyme family protein [Planctomycetaceae bacterium]
MTKSKAPNQTFVQPDKPAGERMVLSIFKIEYPFRWCPPGSFLMGSPPSEKKRDYSEDRPNMEIQHQVTLTQGFWMLETQVTQKMWKGIMGGNPSHFKGVKRPVDSVSWEDCQGYIQKLNDMGVAPAGYHFSLPTEAQWEYACRAGTKSPFNFGRIMLGGEANCTGGYPTMNNPALRRGEMPEKTTVVGAFPANAWGLYDMHGNVFEWCLDCYEDYPGDDARTDPVVLKSRWGHVVRGGTWRLGGAICRSASRLCSHSTGSDTGVRLALIRDK